MFFLVIDSNEILHRMDRSALSALSDVELVAQMQSENRAAFGEAMVRYGGVMLACARRICGQLADDAVQDAWLDVFSSIQRFEGRSSLKTWLVRIAMNKSLNLVRRGGRHISLDTDPSDPLADAFLDDGHWRARLTPWHHDTPEALLSAHVLAECLDKHLDLMPTTQQIAVQLIDMGQVPPDEVASELGMALGTLRVNLHRGRLRLFNMINHYEQTGDC